MKRRGPKQEDIAFSVVFTVQVVGIALALFLLPTDDLKISVAFLIAWPGSIVGVAIASLFHEGRHSDW